MRREGLVCFLVIAAAISGSAAADTLQLQKGETLTGTLTLVADGVVHFKTKLAGQVIVPVEEVARLSTDAPVQLTTKGGTVLHSRITLQNGGLILDSRQKPLPLDHVDRIEPDDDDREGPGPRNKVSAETGVLLRFGDKEYADAFGRLGLSSEFDDYLFRGDLFVERSDADEFPRWLTGAARLQFHPGRVWQPAIGLDFERDTDKALRSRAGLNMGLVRAWPESGLEAEAGLQAETSRWRRGPTDEDLNLRVALRYTRQVFDSGAFTGSLSLTPSLTHPDRLRASSLTSVEFPFAPRIHLKLNLLVDYEDYPQLEDLPKWRTTIGASLLWGF